MREYSSLCKPIDCYLWQASKYVCLFPNSRISLVCIQKQLTSTGHTYLLFCIRVCQCRSEFSLVEYDNAELYCALLFFAKQNVKPDMQYPRNIECSTTRRKFQKHSSTHCSVWPQNYKRVGYNYHNLHNYLISKFDLSENFVLNNSTQMHNFMNWYCRSVNLLECSVSWQKRNSKRTLLGKDIVA